MTRKDILSVHDLVDADPKSKIVAANKLLELAETDKRVSAIDAATGTLTAFFMQLLNNRQYTEAAMFAWGNKLFNPEPRSVQMVLNSQSTYHKNLYIGSSSVGKCLGRGTKVVMFDGTLKKVEDVLTGDRLMGDDSTRRNVLSVTNGVGQLYRIVPQKGEPWVCNENHILTLQCGVNQWNNGHKTLTAMRHKGVVIDIPIRDWLGMSKDWRKDFRQFSVGVELPQVPVEHDPYIYGLWLGDGGVNHPVLHNTDPVLIKTWCNYFSGLGYRIANSTGSHNRIAYFVRKVGGKFNPVKSFFRRSFIDEEKRVMDEYLRNSRDVRLAVLAGLIDTDGWSRDSSFFITTKYKGLAQDIKYLARSCGFSSNFFPQVKHIRKIGFKGTYYTCYISGDTSVIPTKLKFTKPYKGIPNVLLTSIKVEDAGIGEYFGFETDGNHRFLLEDFTVTHNSYNIIAWLMLRYVHDHLFTNVKLVAPTAGHAFANIWSTLATFHSSAIIPFPGVVGQHFIGVDPIKKQAGISIVAVPQGDEGKGRLQGFHPLPRKETHPLFGPMSAVILYIDEGEDAPVGLWQGVDNMLANEDEYGSVQIASSTNPKKRETPFGKRAEPKAGWGSIHIDKDEQWDSHEGWHVTRLDAAKSENVIQKKMVYPGLQTYQGFANLVRRGTNDPSYSTFARGWYPEVGAEFYVCPPYILNDVRGTYLFARPPTPCASFDPAFAEGGDDPALTVGRFGFASAFDPFEGKRIIFKNKRWVLQVEQQFPVKKDKTPIMAANVQELMIKLGVRPEWMVLDRTGNSQGIYDTLSITFGNILGVCWGDGATSKKVLEEDTQPAEELYIGVWSEMHFAAVAWMEHGYMKFLPSMQTQKLFSQFTGRKYEFGTKTLRRVEPKSAYKLRVGGESPDWSDSCIMLPHLIRMRQGPPTAMMPDRDNRDKEGARVDLRDRHLDEVEAPKWVSME